MTIGNWIRTRLNRGAQITSCGRTCSIITSSGVDILAVTTLRPEILVAQKMKVVILGANVRWARLRRQFLRAPARYVVMLARDLDKAKTALGGEQSSARADAVADRVKLGTYDHDLERTVAEADLVFESLAEDLSLKKTFFDRVDKCRRADSIIATGTCRPDREGFRLKSASASNSKTRSAVRSRSTMSMQSGAIAVAVTRGALCATSLSRSRGAAPAATRRTRLQQDEKVRGYPYMNAHAPLKAFIYGPSAAHREFFPQRGVSSQ